MYYIFQILLFPIRFFQFCYYSLFGIFYSGNHIFISLPTKFASSSKSTLASFLSDDSEEVLLFEFLNDLELIVKNSKIKFVSMYIPAELEYGLAEVYQITSLIQKIKNSGKEISAYSPRGDLKSLYILSFFDKKYIPENTEYLITLPSSESFFFGGLFKKLGVEVEAYASGAYKSFGEMFNRISYSKEAKENLTNLIRSLRTQILETFYENSKLESSVLKKIILTSKDLREAGFIQEFLEEEKFCKGFEFSDFAYEAENPVKTSKEISLSGLQFHANKKNFKFIKPRFKSIVILPLKGTIDFGKIESEEIKSDAISAYPVVKKLRELREDKNIQAVILEIDSPGGSASASEYIYSEIKKLSERKKVYAYFQNVSASGGYYISTACHKIYSTPLTITGSIGTVLIRPNLKKFYNTLGITKDRIEFYPTRDILSEYGPLSAESIEYLNLEIKRVNSMFYERVIKSRNKTLKAMQKLGEGRVFSGKSFLASGMVDANLSIIDLFDEIKKEFSKEKLKFVYQPSVYTLKTMVRENIKLFQSILKLKNSFLEIQNLKRMNLKSREAELFYSKFINLI